MESALGVAHDMKSPLTASGLTALVHKKLKEDTKVGEAWPPCIKEVDRLEAMVGDAHFRAPQLDGTWRSEPAAS